MTEAPRRRRRLFVALGVIAAVVVTILVGAGAWLIWPQQNLPEAEAALASTPGVAFEDAGGWLAYEPTAADATVGIVLYPGAKVTAEAYAPTAQAIAAQGYAAYVVRLPLNLAFLAPDAAVAVRDAEPGIRTWTLWGHSLGGAMAGQHAAEQAGTYAGIAFCGSYPNGDLSPQAMAATSIYGTLDGGLERITSDETRALLPADTTFVPIEGGNHEGCGWYTGQLGDPPAEIDRIEQQRQVVEATLAMLRRLGGGTR